MLRPFDSDERKRRIIVSGVAGMRGSALQQVRDSYRINRRVSAAQVGWIAAFRDYPFITSYETAGGRVDFCDVEQTVSSDGSGLVLGSLSGAAWRFQSGSWNELQEDEALKLMNNPKEWDPSVVRSYRNAQEMFDQTTVDRFRRALLFLLAEDNIEEAVIRLFGDAAELTPKQAIVSTRVGDRLGFDHRARDWQSSLVQSVMRRVDPALIKSDLSIGELLASILRNTT